VDISENVRSASEYSFIIHSSVEGGSLYRAKDVEEMSIIRALIRRAYASVSD